MVELMSSRDYRKSLGKWKWQVEANLGVDPYGTDCVREDILLFEA